MAAPDPAGTSRNGAHAVLSPADQQDYDDRQYLDYYIHLPDMHYADEPPAFERLYDPVWMRRVKEIQGRRPDLYVGILESWANRQRPLGLSWQKLDRMIRDVPDFEIHEFPHVPEQLMPALPSEAYLAPDLGAHAAPWLDAYIAYSQHWATRAATHFHEAVGLWMMSTIGARRIRVVWNGDNHFSNLFLAMVARSTLYTKSTVAKLGREALKQAGCNALLFQGKATPHAFMQDLSGHVDPDYPYLSPEKQEEVHQRLAFAAQCGWYLNEWGGMLSQMHRSDSPMADFHDLIRQLDDNESEYVNRTISRGKEIVTNPYLAFLASATPSDLQKFLATGSRWWSDGFWPRFAIITPGLAEQPSDAEAPEGLAVMPASLCVALHDWHVRLGIPQVFVEQVIDVHGKPTSKWRATVTPLACTEVGLSQEARAACHAYSKALWSLVKEGKAPEHFASCYGRFAEKALRIAMLLASIEDHPEISLEHWAYAQRITERWRNMLHEVVEIVEHSQPLSREEVVENKCLRALTQHGALSINDLRQRHVRASTAELLKAMEHLCNAGAVGSLVKGKKTLFYILVPTSIDESEEVAI
jgi:Protein of unknown function (DUF3987)